MSPKSCVKKRTECQQYVKQQVNITPCEPLPQVPGNQSSSLSHDAWEISPLSDTLSDADSKDADQLAATYIIQTNKDGLVPLQVRAQHAAPVDATTTPCDYLSDADSKDAAQSAATYIQANKEGLVPLQVRAQQAAPVHMTTTTRDYLQIYTAVRATGQYNFRKACIPIPSGLHIAAWKRHLTEYYDHELIDFLQFGWPSGYALPWLPHGISGNHLSARAFPQHVEHYIRTESHHRAILGPFAVAPFPEGLHTSPLMSRPKKNSDERRIIVDLSWPTGTSVNYGIPSDTYLDVPYKLQLPTVDQLADRIVQSGPYTHIYVIDISRAYRNLRLDPLSWPLMGIEWDRELYCDISIPFGLRTGAFFCQRTTTAIAHMMKKQGYDILPYIDDIAGADQRVNAWSAFNSLKCLLRELGLPMATNKIQPPSSCATWLGITFDTEKMEMRIPGEKLQDTLILLRQWKQKQSCSYTELQSLLGKLHHISKCCKPARLFVGRMLCTLREHYHTRDNVSLDDQFQRDIAWFLDFLPSYNGKALLTHSTPDFTTEVDACLTGCGGICNGVYYHCQFPDFVLQEGHHISRLEMLNVVIAAKMFHTMWAGLTIQLLCDNTATVSVLQTGRSRDSFLLACAREVWYLSAIHDFVLLPCHAPGATLQTADSLSRFHLKPSFRSICARLPHEQELKVDERLFKLCSNY